MRPLFDIAALRERVQTSAWAADMLQKIKLPTDWWCDTYRDDPACVSGWGHHYSCERCSGRLQFHPEAMTHVCPACGHENEDARFDNSWAYFYRDEAAKHTFYAGVLYLLTGEPRYPNLLRRVLDFYTEYDGKLRVEGPGFRGRFAGHQLCDAVSLTWMMFGLCMMKDAFTAADLDRWREGFIRPECAHLHAIADKVHNIPAWQESSVAIAAMVMGGMDELLRAAFHGPMGLIRQLEEGTSPEGMWYEYSMHYHMYTLETATYAALLAQRCGLPEADLLRPHLERMAHFALSMAFADGTLPNPNDGWPKVRLDCYANQLEFLTPLVQSPLLDWALATAYGREGGSMIIGGMTDWTSEGWVGRLLFGRDRSAPALPRPSYLAPGTQMCVLRAGGAEAFIKYGLRVRGHAHPDLMNIELFALGYPISHDLSANGYGSFLFREWQRTTLAHNTVVTDGRDQTGVTMGMALSFDHEGRISVTAPDVYEGVRYTRSLALTSASLEDSFEAASADDHVYDYVFYAEGAARTALPAAPGAVAGQDGYRHLQNVRAVELLDAASATVTFDGPRGALALTLRIQPGDRLYLVDAYKESTANLRGGVILRREAQSTTFSAEYAWV